MLSEDWHDKGHSELFIDRDGEMFKHILRFLRASPPGKVELVRSLSRADRIALAEEANFFQLGNLRDLLGQPEVLKLRCAYWCDEDDPYYDRHGTRNARTNAETVALLSQGFEILSSNEVHGVWSFLLASHT